MAVEASTGQVAGDALSERFEAVRCLTETLAAPLSPEDQTVQSMPDVSPTKWHRAHTTWFFETFLLGPNLSGYRVHHPQYGYLFNSYYETLGARHPRPERGHLSRPGSEEIARYRHFVDDAMQELLGKELQPTTAALVELGLHHEQQHQELLLMDIKHVLSRNPLRPAYQNATEDAEDRGNGSPAPLGWWEHPGGLVEIGFDGSGFAFDNESPRHRVFLEPFALADRAVSCGEWLEFMADGGYCRPELWLSEGWAYVQATGLRAPLYWSEDSGVWSVFSLRGDRPVEASEPVCHLTYYEADAYAHWAGARVPTEFEWEAVAQRRSIEGRFLDLDVLRPRSGGGGLFGDVWEWTSSSYLPYPGFRPADGAVGEYNGKFMIGQQVLRGGCCVTPEDHLRATYRNFFPASAAWAFSGLRLAKDS